MPGPHHQLTALQVRKQLLLVESEVNRAQLVAELEGLNNHVQGLAHQCKTFASLVSSVASGVNSIRSMWPESGNPSGNSWFSRVKGYFRAGASVWDAFRSKKS